MVKTFRLKHISPAEALEKVHRAGIIAYLFNWGYTIDEKRNVITFNVRYGGGTNLEQEKKMMRELESFIKSIDAK
jgi:hypothetical protein